MAIGIVNVVETEGSCSRAACIEGWRKARTVGVLCKPPGYILVLYLFVFTGPKAVGWVAGSDAVVDSGGRAMEYESCVRLSFAAYTLFVL
jgi:hypothetical protein